jgi:hypothetical protein
VRIVCSRLLLVVALGLLPMCLGGLSGCDSKPADGTLVETPQITADQKAEVKAQYQKQLQRHGNSSTKGKTSRRRS